MGACVHLQISTIFSYQKPTKNFLTKKNKDGSRKSIASPSANVPPGASSATVTFFKASNTAWRECTKAGVSRRTNHGTSSLFRQSAVQLSVSSLPGSDARKWPNPECLQLVNPLRGSFFCPLGRSSILTSVRDAIVNQKVLFRVLIKPIQNVAFTFDSAIKTLQIE